MSGVNLVRPSRDGDQFHYLWAARRCLRLLSPDTTLKAITIEGSSPEEADAAGPITAGEELIDVGEYYGSENLERAELVRYIQIKHSTLRVEKPWTPSELEKTLRGFSDRYRQLLEHLKADDLCSKAEFWFVSNRKLGSNLLETIQDISNCAPARHPANLKKLEQFTDLQGKDLTAFCKLLRLEDQQDGLWDQQNMLVQDISRYLADADADAHMQLKELVVKKVLSSSASNPAILRTDVLRALRTDESELFPAPCLIEEIQNAVAREQEPELLEAIVRAGKAPIIVHAAGGVGKSVFSTRIKLGLPEGSWSVLYDCFGNGQYRSATGYRHRHKDALVQIANELAGQGLCHPLIPTPHADSSAYVRAFIYRLVQSISSLRSKNPEALLCITVDAADNAQMAAEEIGETRSFVRDLIRETMPDGVRLVMLCRTHRQSYLDPPYDVIRHELRPFTRAETAQYLRQKFASATDRDIDEFHRLSSQNPRVQALALSKQESLSDVLRGLGPNPKSVEDMIGGLLDASIDKLRDSVGAIEKTQIDRICAGLAALRPLIPLPVLGSISSVDEAAIKSFVFDLGRPLLIAGNMIQFLDEPTETWFRERFRPTASELEAFIASLKPLASESAYVASALPQLMLEADHLSELVDLALSSEALPTASPIERRDAELQRLQFALKASLRARRHVDAAKLALKTGGESAGDERQRRLLQANTDLAGILMQDDRVQELVSRRVFGSGWTGSHNAYEAALLSAQRGLLGDARSRLRMAFEWINSWIRLPSEERERERIEDGDILELITASFNIHGPESCAHDLRRWRPREISFRVGRDLANRFVDHGRFDDLDALAIAAGNDLPLVLAITLELRKVHRLPPKNVVGRALRLASNRRIELEDASSWQADGSAIRAVAALVEAAYRSSVESKDTLIKLLSRYIPTSPPRDLSSRYSEMRFPTMRAYALLAALEDRSIDLNDLAHGELRKELENSRSQSQSQQAREFNEIVGALLPWHQLWADVLVGRIADRDLPSAIATARAASDKANAISYRERSSTSDEIAQVWLDVLLVNGKPDSDLVSGFSQWVASLKQPLFASTLTSLARTAARCTMEALALEFASNAYHQCQLVREDAGSRSDSFIQLARATLIISRAEAIAYFDQAVEVASKIGDENLQRWNALLDLADRATTWNKQHPQTAYRLARCAELTYEYVVRDKHFDWEATIEAITGLCGRSAFAILSRWRDRDFGSRERLLPVATKHLLEHGEIDPRTALALIGFRADWSEPRLLASTLANCSTKSVQDAAVALTYRYMSFDNQRAQAWRDLKSTLEKYQVTLPEVDSRIAFGEREEKSIERSNRSRSATSSTSDDTRPKSEWNSIFDDIDLTDPNDLHLAYKRFECSEPPYDNGHFFEEAFDRIAPGKEAAFILSLADVPDFGLYEFRTFFEKVPKNWSPRLAVKQAIASTLKSILRRHCTEIRKNRYYETLPLEPACALAGVSEAEAIDVVLDAVGDTAELSDPDHLFSLVGLIAHNLGPDESLQTLQFGLDLLDPILEDSDGDGPWNPTFEPPADLEDSVAGYIWACLGAPQASLRWEAAHVVRALCSLRCERPLRGLVAFANGVPAHAFYDHHLCFYEMHARQWLLIGLARAAQDNPDVVAPHAAFLMQIAFEGEPHVLMREFARGAMCSLVDAGHLTQHTDLRERLAKVNKSPFSPVVSAYHERRHCEHDETEDADTEQDDKFYFGIDMGPYWYAPLGRAFAISQKKVEREALHVIRHDWGLSVASTWEADERHRRKIFKDRETYHSHGGYPRTDELRFYLSYHAMMVAAGKLLATTPVHKDPDESVDEFQPWLARHGMTRDDGGWLADRRDPTPLVRPEWKDQKEADEWRWSVQKHDFDAILFDKDGRINLWGHWTRVGGRRTESIHVGSALVSPSNSSALLRALQCTANPHDYRIPDANDELQIDAGEFRLVGWVLDRSGEGGIDDKDPWAGSIKYPPPTIAHTAASAMNIARDAEGRRWHRQSDQECVAWSEVWGSYESDDDEYAQESGYRLQLSHPFVIAMLQELRMDLIVEVEIERRRTYARWESSQDDNIGFVPPYARIFLIRSDGSVATL